MCLRECAAAGGSAWRSAGRRGAGGPSAPARGVQWKVRGRTRASAGREAACRRPRSRPVPPAGRRLPQRPRSIKRSSKACLCSCLHHSLVTALTLKNLLTSLFLTSATVLLRVPLAQFHSSKLWPCLRLPKTLFSPPAFD